MNLVDDLDLDDFQMSSIPCSICFWGKVHLLVIQPPTERTEIEFRIAGHLEIQWNLCQIS